MSSEVFHKEVWFGGHVQGVGFRYMARRVAQGFEVAGVVRNLADGRVYLQAEGAEAEVADFFVELRRQLASYIRETEERQFWGNPCFKGFSIGCD
jgi:acylphosphatase